jgi:hypothetical protein
MATATNKIIERSDQTQLLILFWNQNPYTEAQNLLISALTTYRTVFTSSHVPNQSN